jgi:hypothetical protein
MDSDKCWHCAHSTHRCRGCGTWLAHDECGGREYGACEECYRLLDAR